MKLRLLIPLLLFASFLAGCVRDRPIPDLPNWGLDYANYTNHDYKIGFQFQRIQGSGQTAQYFWEFPPNRGGSSSSMVPHCDHLRSGPEKAWLHVTIREPNGTEIVGSQFIGPIVFEGNWTGLQCGHHYVFHLLDSDFNVEAYEKIYYTEWNWFSERQHTRRGDDLKRVPV